MQGTLLRSFELDSNTAKVLTNAVSLAQKVDVPHGTILWQLLDYAWLPQKKSSPEVRSSLADLLPGTIPQSQSTTDRPSSEHTSSSTVSFSTGNVLPQTYARMLGEDMGGVLSEAIGDNSFQAFGQTSFPHTASTIF